MTTGARQREIRCMLPEHIHQELRAQAEERHTSFELYLSVALSVLSMGGGLPRGLFSAEALAALADHERETIA